MGKFILYFVFLLKIIMPGTDPDVNLFKPALSEMFGYHCGQELAPMDALDLVKKYYADNFIKICIEGSEDNYYYKAEHAEYYLAYEGKTGKQGDYLIHLYEVVIDEPKTGIGHCTTYGWYTVSKKNGQITAHP